MSPLSGRLLRWVASGPDMNGILARVSSHLFLQNASIHHADQFKDAESNTFFMRYEFSIEDSEFSVERLKDSFLPIASDLNLEWRMTDASRKPRIVLMVSKFDHCLAYIMHRWKVGDLAFELPCVISNGEDLRKLVEWYGVPYHCVPVPTEPMAKQAAFEKISDLITSANPDAIVLARYMQILPAWLCDKYRFRIINIHHSFLPSFVGAKPYHQAKERGVKLIGATCHYITRELDEGPIIEQDVVRVRHNDSVKDMMRLGKDIENTVLAKGLRFHLEDRVIVHGKKTIVFV